MCMHACDVKHSNNVSLNKPYVCLDLIKAVCPSWLMAYFITVIN
jgi:hypothetical protein